MSNDTPALHEQIGGSHYRTLAIQPMEFSTLRGYDPCAHTILKYLTRFDLDGGKGRQDLEKAEHSTRLRIDLLNKWPHDPGFSGYSPGRYCSLNHFAGRKAHAICLLDAWVMADIANAAPLTRCIRELLEVWDG